MKHFEFICAALLIGVVACQKEVVNEQKPQGPATTSIMAGIDLTKTSVDNVSGKVTWAEGDRINVKCGDVYATFVLDPEYAGKSIGKFVTIDQISFAEGDEIAAVYPASVMNTSDGTLTWPSEQTYAENAGCPMYVSGTVTEEGVAPELTFKNLGSILSFNLKTNEANMKVNRIEIESNDAIAGTFTVADDMAVINGDIKAITLDCSNGIRINSDRKAFNVAIPANVSGEDYDNVKIKVFANNRQVYFSAPKTLTLARNTVYNVNTVALEEPSNCYILAPGEKVTIRYMGQSEVNDWSGWRTLVDGGVTSAGMLWKSVNTSEDPADKEIVKTIEYDNATGLLSIEAGSVEGNEVVGVFDESGTILWSYHIWVASSISDVSFAGSTFMDRCLGVVKQPVYGASEAENAGSYGLLYQHFRKDPIMGFEQPGSATPANVAVSEGLVFGSINLTAGSTIEGMKIVDYLTSHPTTRVVYQSADFKATSLQGRWSRDKGAQDPCPAGYRVPATTDVEGCYGGVPEKISAVVRDPLVTTFVGAGGKYYDKSGNIGGTDIFNVELIDTEGEKCLNLTSGTYNMWGSTSCYYSNYYQVRCVKINNN